MANSEFCESQSQLKCEHQLKLKYAINKQAYIQLAIKIIYK